jgi:GNAT superfamily N-acetyltransferase
MIKIIEKKLTVEEYLSLRASVGWKKLSDRQAELAIQNALFMVTAYDGDTLIGMGRVVGDGGVISYIQDLIVSPRYHGQGIGSMLIERLRDFVLSLKQEDEEMMLCLMCAKGREYFYVKNGFTPRPTDTLGPGMIMYLV